MDTTLKELIDKIKDQGIKSAEAQGQEILDSAKEKAQHILDEAKKKAAAEIAKAKEEADRLEASAKASISQAGRDLLLALEKKVIALFESVVDSSVKAEFGGDTLKNAIVAVVSNWEKGSDAALDVLLNEKDLKALESNLKSALSAQIKKGVEIKTAPNVNKGFLLGEKDGSAYYNFTAEGLAEMIGEYLNPKLSQIMREAAEQKG